MQLSDSEKISITFDAPYFIARAKSKDAQNLLRKNYFYLDKRTNTFRINNPIAAARLREYADDKATKEINRKMLHVTPWAKPLQTPPGLELMPYQVPVVEWMLSRNRSYSFCDPGTGKGVMAPVVAANLAASSDAPWRFCYICPPFLVENVADEFAKWAPNLFVRKFRDVPPFFNLVKDTVLIVPDSMLLDESSYIAMLSNLFPADCKSFLFVDEAHRYKNASAGRTQELLGSEDLREAGAVDLFDGVAYLSGSPLENGRPIELFPILNKSAPEVIGFANRFQFGRRYCAAHDSGFGWDFSGASNVEEFSRKLRDRFLVRLEKKALNLPPVVEELLIVSDDMPSKLAEMDARILRANSVDDLMKGVIADARGVDEDVLHVSTYRKHLGLAKVPFGVEAVKYLMTETNESVLLFAHHVEVIEALEKKLSSFKPLVITGKVKNEERHARVKKFQSEAEHRLVIANTQAGGIGFTMTKASRVILLEPDWVPERNRQAIDRASRIGQTKSVFAQYVVYKDSIDKVVMESNFRKQKVINKI